MGIRNSRIIENRELETAETEFLCGVILKSNKRIKKRRIKNLEICKEPRCMNYSGNELTLIFLPILTIWLQIVLGSDKRLQYSNISFKMP